MNKDLKDKPNASFRHRAQQQSQKQILKKGKKYIKIVANHCVSRTSQPLITFGEK